MFHKPIVFLLGFHPVHLAANPNWKPWRTVVNAYDLPWKAGKRKAVEKYPPQGLLLVAAVPAFSQTVEVGRLFHMGIWMGCAHIRSKLLAGHLASLVLVGNLDPHSPPT